MKKLLTIIIPRYMEREKDIFPLLSSINNQVGIDLDDISVIIVNDGSKTIPISQSYLSMFNMEATQITLEENSGSGVARQAGLDYATSQYVMFCDADDTLHSVGVLGAILQEIDINAPDIIKSMWLEEQKIGDCWNYINHELENTWMHGKVFRRQFLLQNNIRFHDTLRVHEDSYFLAIADALTENKRLLNVTTYVWKWNPDSITRRNDAVYLYESFPTFIQACTMAFAKVEEIKPDAMRYAIVQFVLYNYFMYHRSDWLQEKHVAYKKESEKTFVECIKPFWHHYTDTPKEYIAEVYDMERKRIFAGNMENELLDIWLQRIGLS